eukprot:scaffold128500_cov41-Prasinocladus_malaysianus.AAC.1
MPFSIGSIVTCTVGNLSAAGQSAFRRSHGLSLDAEVPENEVVRGAVVEIKGGWVTVAFQISAAPAPPTTLKARSSHLTAEIGNSESSQPRSNSHRASRTGIDDGLPPVGEFEVDPDECLADYSSDEEYADDSAPADHYTNPREGTFDDWTPVTGVTCNREVHGLSGPPRCGHMAPGHTCQTPLLSFMSMFPLNTIQSACDRMNRRARQHTEQIAGRRKYAEFEPAEFYVFLGLCLATTRYQTTSLEELWDVGHPGIACLPVQYGFGGIMSQTRFKEWRQFFMLPGSYSASERSATAMAESWVDCVNARWADVIVPGTYITVDESGAGHQGSCGDMHLSYIPRKPEPIQWQFKTAADSKLQLFLRAEFQANKEHMAKKKWAKEFGATTA